MAKVIQSDTELRTSRFYKLSYRVFVRECKEAESKAWPDSGDIPGAIKGIRHSWGGPRAEVAVGLDQGLKGFGSVLAGSMEGAVEGLGVGRCNGTGGMHRIALKTDPIENSPV